MSVVAHIGSPLARSGGPAGVVRQLKAGFAVCGTGGHRIILPPEAPADASPPPRLTDRLMAPVRKLRHAIYGPPKQYRPDIATLKAERGHAERVMSTVWSDGIANAARQLDAAADADLLIMHDVPGASLALQRRRPGQQVWLVMHPPLPLALFHIWCYAVPEEEWQSIVDYPDVRRWIDRELDVWRRVDRVFIATPDALDELVRVDPRFATAGRMIYALTGASAGPVRDEPATTLRGRWGLPLDQPVGLFLGNTQPYRGFDRLLSALDALPDPAAVPGMIVVAGPPALTVPRHDRLRPLGPVSDVGGLLRAVDFFVNVNRFNLFDLSIIEAAEAGLPLLLHRTGGNRSFERLGAGCVMFNSLEPREVAEAIAAMFAMRPDERRELGERSRVCHALHLTPERYARRHLAMYNEVLAS